MLSGFSISLHWQTMNQNVFQGPSHSRQHLLIRNPPINWQGNTLDHRKEDTWMCFALPCYPLSAAVSSEGREKGTQICSTSLLARPWQKSSELLGLLINMPSGQAGRAMKLCRGKGVVDIFKHISEFSKFRSSCSDNQLLFSLSSHSC